jgi:hypothetical protein
MLYFREALECVRVLAPLYGVARLPSCLNFFMRWLCRKRKKRFIKNKTAAARFRAAAVS